MPIPSPRVTEVIHKDGPRPKQVRISAKVRQALRYMAFEGIERKKAAEKAGLKDDSLYVALRRPEVKQLLNEYVADLRKSAAARSIARVDKLADSAESEHVRLHANTFLLGIEGVRPAERHEHKHEHRIVPGYVLDPHGHDEAQPAHIENAGFIDGEGHEVDAAADNCDPVQLPAPGADARSQVEGGAGVRSARHEKGPGGKNGPPR